MREEMGHWKKYGELDREEKVSLL